MRLLLYLQVHYQLPASADLYVHRSGRTARAASDGVAVALVTPSESRRWDALQTALDRPAVPEFPVVSSPHLLDCTTCGLVSCSETHEVIRIVECQQGIENILFGNICISEYKP